MINEGIAQTNQQQKSEKPQGSGILQRAAVRPVSDVGMQSTDDKQALALSNSAFSKDFSQVPIRTTKPQQFQARNLQSYPVQPIQAKLTIGEPGDRYEQEADRVAAEVVRRINAPSSARRSVQHQEKAEEEIRAKPEITALQRMKEPEAELQAKLTLPRSLLVAGGEASTDLASAINSARGSGQPLEAVLQQSMGQAMGADFSGVRVHRDAQSDHLNQSIQARAFTTGQDVFFRQGEYKPGSRGGQELIAHELTHVVQQKGGVVQRGQKRDPVASNLNYRVLANEESYYAHVVLRVTTTIEILKKACEVKKYLTGQGTSTALSQYLPLTQVFAPDAEAQAGKGMRGRGVPNNVDAAHIMNTTLKPAKLIQGHQVNQKQIDLVYDMYHTTATTTQQLQENNIGPDKIIDGVTTKFIKEMTATAAGGQNLPATAVLIHDFAILLLSALQDPLGRTQDQLDMYERAVNPVSEIISELSPHVAKIDDEVNVFMQEFKKP